MIHISSVMLTSKGILFFSPKRCLARTTIGNNAFKTLEKLFSRIYSYIFPSITSL